MHNIADTDGNPINGPEIVKNINTIGSSYNITTEKAVVDYINANAVMNNDIADSTNINTDSTYASNFKVISEKAMHEVLGINIIEPTSTIEDDKNMLEDESSNI